MQSDSTSKSSPEEIKSTKLLNVNAPIFEPKHVKLNSNSSDPVWCKFTIPEDIKSTILIPPPRQQYISPVANFSYPAYIYPSNNQHHPSHLNGSSQFYPMQPITIDAHSNNPQTIPISDTHINNIGTFAPVLSVDQKESINVSQISISHSNTDPQAHTQSTASSIGVGVNQSLILPQNQLSTIMWPSHSQSQSVALYPNYYTGQNNIYFIRSPQLYASVSPYVISQNKSATKVYIRNRIFNTGDPELDILLNELVKRINPVDEFVFRSNNSRFFVIKSFTEDNIYQSIRHGVWCSTPGGNETLVSAYNDVKSREILDDETTKSHVYLFFSVNGSGYFCGVAEMTSELHSSSSSSIWNQKKWQNQFSVNWLYIKDVPNSYLRQIKLECNDNRPVTNCRDATEILPIDKGIEVLKIIHNIHYDTCLLNDFPHETVRLEKS